MGSDDKKDDGGAAAPETAPPPPPPPAGPTRPDVPLCDPALHHHVVPTERCGALNVYVEVSLFYFQNIYYVRMILCSLNATHI